MEILRNKLPAGIRELCVSLGGGDSASFRILEGAIEHIANEIAAASEDKLRNDAERLRQRFRAIEDELATAERAEREYASKYFPNRSSSSSDTRVDAMSDIIHREHLVLLGVQPGSPMGQLADAVESTLASRLRRRHSSMSVDDEEEDVSSSALPRRAYFLEDVQIDPLRPPPSEALIDDLRVLRRKCGEALRWESVLRSKDARCALAENMTTESLRRLIHNLRSRTETISLIGRGKLPAIVNRDAAQRLHTKLSKLRDRMIPLEQESKRMLVANAVKSQYKRGQKRKSISTIEQLWAFRLLRHCDNGHVSRSLGNVKHLMTTLQKKWRGVAQVGTVFIPEVLQQMCDIPITTEYALNGKAYDDRRLDDIIVGKANEFATEVRWRAHPESRGFFQNMMRQKPSQTLIAELGRITVDGKTPDTRNEYKVVEQWILLRSCEARLRDEWNRLRAIAPSMEKFPETNLIGTFSSSEMKSESTPILDFVQRTQTLINLCVDAVEMAQGLGDVAAIACGRPLVFLNILSQGVAACDEELTKLRQTLSVHGKNGESSGNSDESVMMKSGKLGNALERKNALLRELGVSTSDHLVSESGEMSPLDALREATENLGRLDSHPSSQIKQWLNARKRVRTGKKSLAHLDELRRRARDELGVPTWARHLTEVSLANTAPSGRSSSSKHDESVVNDPCPRDARRIWAAIAARNAISDASERRRVRETGDKKVIHRLMKQRDACVKHLVAAVAKAELRSAMTPETSAGLLRLVSAVASAGRTQTDSLRSQRHRADVAAAMADCAMAVPIWIMPTWRVSQCLPPDVGSFDLVIIDEASQSDITALPVIMRGAKLLVVGDHKQVSPTGAFISEAKIRELKARLFASRHPYVEQLLPGRSIFDLAQTCFADCRTSLLQHYRCVPACIALSNELFYHGRLQPRRLPLKSKRLEPALLDVYVQNGKKRGKVNVVEANALVTYLQNELRDGSELCKRNASVGIISLMGHEQTRVIRSLVLESLTDAQIAKHRIVVGEPSGLQGDERDVILLSMVASKGASPYQTGRMYEQRFNVALSRARDRMVLFRSIKSNEISSREDLKVRTIQFFEKKRGGRRQRPRGGDDGVNLFTDSSVEGSVLNFLKREGYNVDMSCRIAGSLCVVEDDDRRLVVCVDGRSGDTLGEWKISMKEQRALELAGWTFFRFWYANWIVNCDQIKSSLRNACMYAGVHAAGRSTAEDEEEVCTSTDVRGRSPIRVNAKIRRSSPFKASRRRASTTSTPSSSRRKTTRKRAASSSPSVGRRRATSSGKKRSPSRSNDVTPTKKKRTTTTKKKASAKKPATRTKKKKISAKKRMKKTRKRRKSSDDDEWVPSDDE